MKTVHRNFHGLTAMAAVMLAGSAPAAQGQRLIISKTADDIQPYGLGKALASDLDPLFMVNADKSPSRRGVEKASSAKGLGAVPLVADVPKLPHYDLDKLPGVAIDNIALKAKIGGSKCARTDGLTKLGNQDADDGPHGFARKVFAAGNLGALVAGTLVAQNLAETARTPAVAFA